MFEENKIDLSDDSSQVQTSSKDVFSNIFDKNHITKNTKESPAELNKFKTNKDNEIEEDLLQSKRNKDKIKEVNKSVVGEERYNQAMEIIKKGPTTSKKFKIGYIFISVIIVGFISILSYMLDNPCSHDDN